MMQSVKDALGIYTICNHRTRLYSYNFYIKTKIFIKWSEIKEVGTGNIPTPFGSKQRIYFCDRVLDEKEKSDLIILKYHTVHFSYIPKECCEKISELLPVPMTEEMKEKYVR